MDRSADNLGQIINDIERELEELKTTQLRVREVLYPVGSIYMSATLTTPQEVAAIFGGTWEAWGSGRVPVGVNASETEFNTVEKTGGSKYLQQHSHNTINWASGYQSGSQSNLFTVLGGDSTTNTRQAVASAGTGDSGNLQPYITCYMYKRVQ